MSDNSFALIAQEIQKQKKMMEALKSENQSLRRQIAELHEGRGIFIEVNGKRIALKSETHAPTTYAVATPQTPLVHQEAATTDEPDVVAVATEMASTTQKDDHVETTSTTTRQNLEAPTTTFLEEIMLNEFESALTSPLPVRKPAPTEEEEKAALRRELMGSFLLE